MIEEIYNKKDLLYKTSQSSPKQFEDLVQKQIEKIKTNHSKINSYLGLRKIKNKKDYFWVKITNSCASLDETNGNMMPHILEGFYVSILGDDDYLHLTYNKPLNHNVLQKITGYINGMKEISVNDFLGFLQKIFNRKADWLDKNI